MDLQQEILADIEMHLDGLGVTFAVKPLVFGGSAMQYYGIRHRGHDIDLIVSFADFDAALRLYPEGKKDLWGDWGVVAGEFELFRTVWKLDLEYMAEGAIDFPRFRMISPDRLLLMKALAMEASDKQKADFSMVVKHIQQSNRRVDVEAFMNAHVASYLASPDGLVYNDRYID